MDPSSAATLGTYVGAYVACLAMSSFVLSAIGGVFASLAILLIFGV